MQLKCRRWVRIGGRGADLVSQWAYLLPQRHDQQSCGPALSASQPRFDLRSGPCVSPLSPLDSFKTNFCLVHEITSTSSTIGEQLARNQTTKECPSSGILIYSVASATSPFASTTIARRDLTEHDVQIEILFCGICHSDPHQARNEWSDFMPTVYPCVPGHEIVGRVTKVGSAVTRFKPGDLAAVGCMVDSDGTCPECKAGLEQFCPNMTLTYNFPDKHTGGVTYGGYSDSIVVTERFVLSVPSNLDLAGTAPLLCAGITTYSPMRH
jgi:hypothetical protein